MIQSAMTSGVTRPYNSYMKALGRAMDIDVTEFMLGDEEQAMLVQMNAPPQRQQEGAEAQQ